MTFEPPEGRCVGAEPTGRDKAPIIGGVDGGGEGVSMVGLAAPEAGAGRERGSICRSLRARLRRRPTNAGAGDQAAAVKAGDVETK